VSLLCRTQVQPPTFVFNGRAYWKNTVLIYRSV